jgi:hypothetical protein
VQRLARAVSAGAQDADTIRQLEDELEAGRAKSLAERAELRCSLAFESERIVQQEMSLYSVRQEFQNAKAAGEATKKQLAESAITAGVCKKRCDTLQASQRDVGKELSGVEERLARAVSAGAKDAGTIRLLEDELEAGRAKWLAVKAELGCSLAFESERNVQLQASPKVQAAARQAAIAAKAMQPRSIGASREWEKGASGLRPHAYHFRMPRAGPLGNCRRGIELRARGRRRHRLHTKHSSPNCRVRLQTHET